MNITNLSPEQKKESIVKVPFPYNHPEILAQYRGQNIIIVDDQIVAAGDVDYRPIFKYYRQQGKEPIIICVPAQ